MRKRITQVLLGMLLLLLPVQIRAAEQLGGVYDDASLLSDTERDTITAQIAELEQETGWAVYAVTTADAGGKSAVEYADDFFDNNSLETEDGIVALIDMDNREIYISTSGIAIRYLTDERLEDILDDAYEEIAEGNYADGFVVMLEDAEKYYQKGIPGGQYNYDTETGEISVYHSLTAGEIVIAIVIAAGVFAAVFGGIIGKYRLKFGTYQYEFRKFSEVNLTDSNDVLINSFVTHRRIPKNDDGGGSGSSGRSSVHTSSSGSSHGGAGRKF